MEKKRFGGVSGDMLHTIVSEVERLEERKEEVQGWISDAYKKAKSQGFDTPTIRRIVKLRKKTKQQREEEAALLDIYKAALGMLDGTPLGEAAIRRLTEEKKPKEDAVDSDVINEAPAEVIEPEEPEITEDAIEEARAHARDAATKGKPVTDNPFGARDPRRAAWDEEWCRTTGSDGMDLPDSWKPKKPKKEDKENK